LPLKKEIDGGTILPDALLISMYLLVYKMKNAICSTI